MQPTNFFVAILKNFGIASLMLICSLSCQNQTKSKVYSLDDIDSVIVSEDIYSLGLMDFNKSLDSLKKHLIAEKNDISVKYYFLSKEFAYNLNHSLYLNLPEIKIFIPYEGFYKTKDINDSLLKNKHFCEFLISYLDLKAKYTIAEEKSVYNDNNFVKTQWDIAMEEFSGKIQSFALYQILKFQIEVMGHEFDKKYAHYI